MGQMFIFKALVDTYMYHYRADSTAAVQLLHHFLDQPDRAFSLHSFCRHRQFAEASSVDVGEFWKSTYAIYTIKYLWKKVGQL